MTIRQSTDDIIRLVDCVRSVDSGKFIFYLALSLKLNSRDMMPIDYRMTYCGHDITEVLADVGFEL
jgi:hypothetical protein